MTRTHVITGTFGSGKTTAICVLGAAPSWDFLELWRNLLRDAANPK